MVKGRPAATLSSSEGEGMGGGGGGPGRRPSPPSSAATRWPECPLPPRPRWSDDRYELIMLQQRMTAVLRSMDAKAASGDFAGALADRDALLPLQLRERHLLLQVLPLLQVLNRADGLVLRPVHALCSARACMY